MNERLRQFADALAVERERSNVSAETLACIRAIVLERETVPEQLEEAAQRIVAGLSDENLAELILTGSKVRWRSKSGGLSATSERGTSPPEQIEARGKGFGRDDARFDWRNSLTTR